MTKSKDRVILATPTLYKQTSFVKKCIHTKKKLRPQIIFFPLRHLEKGQMVHKQIREPPPPSPLT